MKLEFMFPGLNKKNVKGLISLVFMSCALSVGGVLSSPQEAYAEHRTNKKEVRRSLDRDYVVLYTSEFSHREMLSLTAALSADYLGGGGTVTSTYLTEFGRRALLNLHEEVERKAPAVAEEIVNGLTLANFLEAMDASFDGGRVNLSIAGIDIQVGRATYNRAECLGSLCASTPNTYQMYIRVSDAEIASNAIPTSPTPTTVAGRYRLPDGTIFRSNASNAYCTYMSEQHVTITGSTEVHPANSFPPFDNHGPCPVKLSAGAYRLVDGTIMSSNGSAYCHYVSYEHYEKKDRRPITHLEGEIPLHAMENHFACTQ